MMSGRCKKYKALDVSPQDVTSGQSGREAGRKIARKAVVSSSPPPSHRALSCDRQRSRAQERDIPLSLSVLLLPPFQCRL